MEDNYLRNLIIAIILVIVIIVLSIIYWEIASIIIAIIAIIYGVSIDFMEFVKSCKVKHKEVYCSRCGAPMGTDLFFKKDGGWYALGEHPGTERKKRFCGRC